jgi:hypothetical protein
MATAIDEQTSVILTPTHDPRPVERAVVESIISSLGPELLLHVALWQPNGEVRLRYAWTRGGDVLGDRVDRDATARGLNLADAVHIAELHRTEHRRGRIVIQAFALRGIHADVLGGVRAGDGDRGAGFAGTWLGVGPGMLNRQWVTS